MKLLAVFLLTVLLSGLFSLNEANIDATHVPLIKSNHLNESPELKESLTETKTISEKESYSTDASINERTENVDDKDALKLKDDLQFMKNFLNPKDMLMQEIHTLNEESKVICIFLYWFNVIIYLILWYYWNFSSIQFNINKLLN